ncbi:hypothetical protein HOLleu_26127 [Holothuria leucospilota]|uniref:Uncharacterized protein n=1 Tax=Holothuria leucospilota TaxID=206669 RepID=A0A9Q1BTV7_HOLLE|nr:hypothetical protein HOLleu_26127 [Holothuria leucospilota]
MHMMSQSRKYSGEARTMAIYINKCRQLICQPIVRNLQRSCTCASLFSSKLTPGDVIRFI